MVRSEGNVSLKNPVTLPGIDPGTFRLVAQRLNHYATPGPLQLVVPHFNLETPYLFKSEFVTTHAIKAPGGNKCLAPSILNLVTRTMTVVTLTFLSP